MRLPKLLLVLFFAPPLSLYAAENGGKVHVHSLDPAYDLSKMKRAGVEVHPYAAPSPAASAANFPDEWSIPNRALREEWFKKSGLASDVSSWDELDRDLLVLKSRNYPLKRLTQSYPKLSPQKLGKLKELALHD